jgi:hypothetical protein
MWCCAGSGPLTASAPGAPGSPAQLGGGKAGPLVAGGAEVTTAVEDIAVKVVIRVRPFLAREASSAAPCVEATGVSGCRIRSAPGEEGVAFTFDCVLGAAATQADTYRAVAAHVLAKALTGFNGCVFAYGQTGSGKTWAMEGSSGTAVDGAAAAGGGATGGAGIIPQLAAALFRAPGENGLATLQVFAECACAARAPPALSPTLPSRP